MGCIRVVPRYAGRRGSPAARLSSEYTYTWCYYIRILVLSGMRMITAPSSEFRTMPHQLRGHWDPPCRTASTGRRRGRVIARSTMAAPQVRRHAPRWPRRPFGLSSGRLPASLGHGHRPDPDLPSLRFPSHTPTYRNPLVERAVQVPIHTTITDSPRSVAQIRSLSS